MPSIPAPHPSARTAPDPPPEPPGLSPAGRPQSGRHLAALLAVAVLALSSVGCYDASLGSPPERDAGKTGRLAEKFPPRQGLNVLVVSFDALRADALGVYGSDRGASPNIDAFAADSLVFRNAYTASAVTPTSFAAFFSGMLPPKVFHRWHFDPSESLAERFQGLGYRTAAILNNVQLMPERGYDRGFAEYDFHSNGPSEEILTQASTWLEQRRNDSQPFFLWVHFLRPHAPYRDRDEARHLYRQSYVGQFAETSGVKFEIQDRREIERLRDLYLGEVWTADLLFARLLSTLRETGLANTTVVALTSDHGEAFHEHGQFQHSLLYEEQLRIPLILHHPDAEGGATTDVRARSIDLMPTLLAAVGHRTDDLSLDGTNLLERSPEDPPSPSVAVITTGKRMMSLLDGDEKLIIDCHSDDPDEPVRVELYDLSSDPREEHDLAGERSDRLRPLLNELRLRVGGSPCRLAERLGAAWEKQQNLDPERLKALKALGYVR